jgi:hypothetical protein
MWRAVFVYTQDAPVFWVMDYDDQRIDLVAKLTGEGEKRTKIIYLLKVMMVV